MKQLKQLIEKIGRDRLAILLIGGLLILVISIPTGINKSKKADTNTQKSSQAAAAHNNVQTNDGSLSISESDYASYLEKKLQNMLQSIDGAGQVFVMVTLSDAGGIVVEKDISYKRENEAQKSANGETTSKTNSSDTEETVFTVDEKGNSIPLVSRQILPSVEGILIVAQGGDKAEVKSEMKQAVLSLFNLDEHKISIVKMKVKNG